MSTEIEELNAFLQKCADKYTTRYWGYGRLTKHLKIMYLIDTFNEILKYISEKKIKLKTIYHLHLKALFKRIDELDDCLKISDDKLHPIYKVNIFSCKTLKYRFLKFYRENKEDNDEKKEFNDLVVECSPVYTMLINRHNSEILKKIPLDLIRYMNKFL